MKRKFMILILIMIGIVNFSDSVRVKWKILSKKVVNYSTEYPNDVVYLIYWRFKSKYNGKIFRGISTTRKVFKKFKKNDVVYIKWDQNPPDFHSIYTFLPKEYDKNENKHIMIINSMEKAK